MRAIFKYHRRVKLTRTVVPMLFTRNPFSSSPARPVSVRRSETPENLPVAAAAADRNASDFRRDHRLGRWFRRIKIKLSKSSTPLTDSIAGQGTFSIVDMSAQWPARKPTAHRAKCDQFVEHLDGLVSELQETKLKLAETQSLLEAHSPVPSKIKMRCCSTALYPNTRQKKIV